MPIIKVASLPRLRAVHSEMYGHCIETPENMLIPVPSQEIALLCALAPMALRFLAACTMNESAPIFVDANRVLELADIKLDRSPEVEPPPSPKS